MNAATISSIPYLSAPLIYIWQDFTLYLGSLPENASHGFYLDTLSINISDNFTVTTNNWLTSRQAKIVFWPASSKHQSQHNFNNDILVYILMEPTTPYAKIVKEHMQGQGDNFYYDSSFQGRIVSILKQIYIARYPSQLAYQKMISALDPENRYATDYINYKIDSRINFVINLLRVHPGKNIKINQLASEVNLSDSRLIHLFKEQTGVSISQMRLWYKIKNATEQLAIRNCTLTEAALESGFVDTAHFSRAYKSLMGMPPSAFFHASRNMEMIREAG